MDKLKQIIKKYWENITWLEVVMISGLAFVMMYGLLYKLGTLSSGYHFLDDHELIRLEIAFGEQQSLGSVMRSWVTNDLLWRFRPLYWVERTMMAYFFGANLLYWNIYTAVKGTITFVLLYMAARYMKCNPVISGIFTVLILYGAQFTPWYRSANQENTGLMLCALTMCLIAAQAYHHKFDSKGWNAAIVVSAVLCGFMKESFTLLLPAFGAIRFWLEYREKAENKLFTCLKKHWAVYGMMALSFMVNILVLLFYVGVDQVSYAGFHEETGLVEYWNGIVSSYQLYLKWYVNIAAVLLFLLVRAGKNNWKKYWGHVLIGFYVIGVQLVAHAKSGMWERYIIPWIVGYAFVFVILGWKILKSTKLSKLIYVLILCILVYMEAPVVLSKARDYAYDGQMTALYFQTILDHTDENSHIISTYYDVELNLSTECWLENHGRPYAYSCDIATGELTNQVQLKGTAPATLDWENAQVVTCYDNQVDSVLATLGENRAALYSTSVNGHYAVIYRNEK